MAYFNIHTNEHGKRTALKFDERTKKIISTTKKSVDYFLMTKYGSQFLTIDYELLDDCVQGVAMLSYGNKYFVGKTFEQAEQKVIDFIKDCVVKSIA